MNQEVKSDIKEYLLKQLKNKISKRKSLRKEIEEQDLPFHRRFLSFLNEEEIKRLLFEGSFVHGL